MRQKSVLTEARQLMRRRKFSAAIRRLESRAELFEGDFEFYLLLGIAHLYLGDTGSAKSFFDQARRIRMMSTPLLLGQAALMLQRGEISRAVPYYTDILEDIDPQNRVARDALEFIRVMSESGDDYGDVIRRMVDTRKIEKFYPPLGFNTDMVWAVVLPLTLGALVALFVMKVWPMLTAPGAVFGPVAEATQVAGRAYVLTDSEIRAARTSAKKELAAGHYAEAVVEANRLLNSNALEVIKEEARSVKKLCYPVPPMFETVGTSYSYVDVAKDPLLYEDCFVVWTGRLIKPKIADGVWKALFVVTTGETSTGDAVHTKFDAVPQIDMERSTSVLGVVNIEDNMIVLEKCKAHQSLKGQLATPD